MIIIHQNKNQTMDRVKFMMFLKILKNRKAMTPLMIGIIVAASVIAVVFIIMMAIIPSIPDEVNMQVRAGTVKPYLNASKGLDFTVICDYAKGEVWKFEILRTNEVWGSKTLSPPVIQEKNNQTRYRIASFSATINTPFDLQDDGELLFSSGVQFTIRVYYRPYQSTITDMYTELLFTYK